MLDVSKSDWTNQLLPLIKFGIKSIDKLGDNSSVIAKGQEIIARKAVDLAKSILSQGNRGAKHDI